MVSLGFNTDGKRIRKKVSGLTKAEVRDKLKELHSELDAGVRTSHGYTVGKAVADWLAEGLPRPPKRVSICSAVEVLDGGFCSLAGDPLELVFAQAGEQLGSDLVQGASLGGWRRRAKEVALRGCRAEEDGSPHVRTAGEECLG